MEPPSTGNITVLNQSGRRLRTAPLRTAAETALSQHGRAFSPVCILLTGDDEVRDLNRRFRGIDENTDVLTFPSAVPQILGDIAISVPYAHRQAEARGVSLAQELGFLAIHGILHLVGFDDEAEADRAEMVDQMNAAAVAAGLKPDYEWSSILHGGQE
jgi:rRNA maturation RNase YbeY